MHLRHTLVFCIYFLALPWRGNVVEAAPQATLPLGETNKNWLHLSVNLSNLVNAARLVY